MYIAPLVLTASSSLRLLSSTGRHASAALMLRTKFDAVRFVVDVEGALLDFLNQKYFEIYTLARVYLFSMYIYLCIFIRYTLKRGLLKKNQIWDYTS